MTLNTENNPCCKKKGTLVITIEPCTKGKETVPDAPTPYYGDRYIPGLPYKTPRTMEIEVKLKGKDQTLFSDEEIISTPSAEEYIEETELVTHSPSGEEEEEEPVQEKSKSRSLSEKSVESKEPEPTISCRTIPLEKKPCSETCPGPLICLPRKHFLGDKCKLHDPTTIGNQILEMHRKGLFKKRLYVNENIYPDHIMTAISEINKKQLEKEILYQQLIHSGDGVVEPEVLKTEVVPLKTVEETKPTVPIRSISKEEQVKRNRSGCYC